MQNEKNYPTKANHTIRLIIVEMIEKYMYVFIILTWQRKGVTKNIKLILPTITYANKNNTVYILYFNILRRGIYQCKLYYDELVDTQKVYQFTAGNVQ